MPTKEPYCNPVTWHEGHDSSKNYDYRTCSVSISPVTGAFSCSKAFISSCYKYILLWCHSKVMHKKKKILKWVRVGITGSPACFRLGPSKWLISALDGKEMVMMTVLSSYSLESAPCPWGSGWKHAALADVSPAPSPAGSAAVAAAAAPDDAPSLQVPAAVSWPGAPAGAEKSAEHTDKYVFTMTVAYDKFCSFCFAVIELTVFVCKNKTHTVL